MEVKQQMIEMRRQGATYREIGLRFDISKQRVHQIIGKLRKRKDDVDLEEIIYEGVYQMFANDEYMTYHRFSTIAYGKSTSSKQADEFRLFLIGKREKALKIKWINNILKYTGKSYEEVFKLR